MWEWKRKGRIHNDSWLFKWLTVLFAKLERQVKTGDTEFCLEYVSFEKPVRHSKGDLIWVVTIIVWSLKG